MIFFESKADEDRGTCVLNLLEPKNESAAAFGHF